MLHFAFFLSRQSLRKGNKTEPKRSIDLFYENLCFFPLTTGSIEPSLSSAKDEIATKGAASEGRWVAWRFHH
jgi:hypothetical protein